LNSQEKTPAEQLAKRLIYPRVVDDTPVFVAAREKEENVAWNELYIECAKLFVEYVPSWIKNGWGYITGFTLVKRIYDNQVFWELDVIKDALSGEDVLEPRAR
jgi:hypothetical protein